MTLCNMAIEAGGRCGMVAPDATTFDYLRGREFAPKDDTLDQAMHDWSRAEIRSRRAVRPRSVDRRDGDCAVRHLGHQPGRRAADRRQRSRPRTRAKSGTREIYPGRRRLYGAGAGQEAHRDRHRPGVHRLLHQCAHRGSARRRRPFSLIASARCLAWCRRARPASSDRQKKKASTGYFATPGWNGRIPVVRCASESTATWSPPANAAPRPPIGIFAAARASARAPISCRRRWSPPPRSAVIWPISDRCRRARTEGDGDGKIHPHHGHGLSAPG